MTKRPVFESSEIPEEDELYLALSIGADLLINGAEVSRVEDTITRICTAFGAKRVDVFTITSSIIVTMNKGRHCYTQTRRITSVEYNMDRLTRLNELSREICQAEDPSLHITEYVDKMEEIAAMKCYTGPQIMLFYALASGAFTVFFGGDLPDSLVSALIALMMYGLLRWFDKLELNRYMAQLITAGAAGIVGIGMTVLGLGHSAEMIGIGNIMLLIPGLALTNGIRDMFSGNIISGILRTCEALLLAIVIALAFTWATILI